MVWSGYNQWLILLIALICPLSMIFGHGHDHHKNKAHNHENNNGHNHGNHRGGCH
jgi:hypothetical protein